MTDQNQQLWQPQPHVLRGYALLADGERGALVGEDGHVTWLCAPRWHDEPVFATLIGGGGSYQVAPLDRWSVWSGSYEPGTLIWRSRWTMRDNAAECWDALAFPGDEHSTVLLRRIVATDGPARMAVALRPRVGYTDRGMTDLTRHEGIWTARLGSLYLRWTGAPDAVTHGADDQLDLVVDVPAGHHHDLALEISDQPLDQGLPQPDRLWRATRTQWQAQVPDFADTLAPRDTRHAYAVLRGLTSATGGMVAAATTSLPEQENGGGNYDYRYAWVRDQSWVGQAIAAHGPHPLVTDAVEFVTARLLDHGPAVRPAYTVTGGSVPPEDALPLPGYPGGSDVVGNKITHQFQLDAFGEALLLFAAAARHAPVSTDTWRAAEIAVDAIGQRWDEPEAGLWELDDRHWTESRLACVAGLRAMATVAPTGVAGGWSDLADTLLARASHVGLHPTGRWRRSPDDDRTDAALLLPALRGAVRADDPRSVTTFRSVRDELCREGYVYRFRHDHRRLGEAEGAFLVAGFLLALTARQQGDQVTAARLFERNRSACGPPGLFAEEYDVQRRQLRGNLPQAFVHGLLIESATRLADPPGAR